MTPFTQSGNEMPPEAGSSGSTPEAPVVPRRFWSLLGAASGLLVWAVAAGVVDQSLILPGPWETLVRAVEILGDKGFPTLAGATLGRILVTLGIDLALALALGIPAGRNPRVEAFFSPFETAMRAVPTMGVLLFSLIVLDSEITPVAVCSLIILPLVYRGVVEGVRSVDPGLVALSRTFRVPSVRQWFRMWIPAIRPFLASGLHNATSLLVKVMITAEVLGQPRVAMGTRFQIARAQLDTPAVLAWSLLVILMGAILEQLVQIWGNGLVRRKPAGAPAGTDMHRRTP